MKFNKILITALLVLSGQFLMAQDFPEPSTWVIETAREYAEFAEKKWNLKESEVDQLYTIRLEMMTAQSYYKKQKQQGLITEEEFKIKNKEYSQEATKKITNLIGKDWRDVNKITKEFWEAKESK